MTKTHRKPQAAKAPKAAPRKPDSSPLDTGPIHKPFRFGSNMPEMPPHKRSWYTEP